MGCLSPTDQKCADSSTYWQFFNYRPPGRFRYTTDFSGRDRENMMPKTQCITIYAYIYRYILIFSIVDLFSISIGNTKNHAVREWELQIWSWCWSIGPEVAPLLTISFECKKKKIKSCQVCDWLAEWLIMSGYMDLRRPRVYRRSNVGLVTYMFNFKCKQIIFDTLFLNWYLIK